MENPEFRRQVWLELTPHRLVAMPLVLGLLFALTHLTWRAAGGEGDDATAGLALWGFGGLLLLWGTRLAADSVTEEVRGRTWDLQRMSALPPWQLTWGKLVGGPIYPWYGALLCAGVYLALGSDPLAHKLAKLVLLGSLGVIFHGVALLAALLAARRGAALPARSMGALPLLAFFFALPLVQATLNPAAATATIYWHGLPTTFFTAAVISSTIFAVWAVVGVHRLMRAELQERNAPLVWLGFLLFVMVWASGFVPRELGLGDPRTGFTPTRVLVAYSVVHAAIYVLLFTERKEPVVFRRLLRFRRLGERERLWDELPLWLVSLPVAGAAAAALLLQPGAVDSAAPGAIVSSVSVIQKQVVASLALLLLRDVGLVLALAFGTGSRRSEMAAAVYLLALYVLAPGIAAQLDLPVLRGFFWPRIGEPSIVVLAPLALEAAGTLGFAWLRWRRAAARFPHDP